MRSRTTTLLALVFAMVVAIAAPVSAYDCSTKQPIECVPAGESVVMPAEPGIFAFGWHDGAHGSDVRNVTVPACETGEEAVVVTNTATQEWFFKWYVNPRRPWLPRGTSTVFTASATCT